MRNQERRVAYKLVGLQALVTLLVSLSFSFGGLQNSISALLGGLASVLPSLYYARRLFVTTQARQVKRIVRAFFLGELTKLLLIAVLVVLFIQLFPVKILPFMVGFVAAQCGFWLAPWVMR